MKIIIVCFTNKGYELAQILKEKLDEHESEIVFKGRNSAGIAVPDERSLSGITEEAFIRAVPLVFIGAAGIAVRSIAPYVRDKLTDPPVIVMDELGRFAVPVLSGHVGGANGLALRIADAVGAVPVITTATDINEAFSTDLFAVENDLRIKNRRGIAGVSSSALTGKPVTISIKDYPPTEPVDVLVTDEVHRSSLKGMSSITLCPKKYALGIGCRRGKTFEELRDFALEVLRRSGIGIDEVGCLATIDVKKDEEGLQQLSQAWRMPLVTFDAAVLAKAYGDFTVSQVVYDRVGVDNVCERAAVIAAGAGSNLVIRKTAQSGMTVAVAEVRK